LREYGQFWVCELSHFLNLRYLLSKAEDFKLPKVKILIDFRSEVKKLEACNPTKEESVAEKVIKRELLAGPKRAKQLVDACSQKGVKRSAVFYWLKEMTKNRAIRKVARGIYELIKLEDADQRRTLFLLEKITDRNPLARKAAIEDFAALCRERRIPNSQQVLSLIKDLLKNSHPELGKAALRFLRFITVNSKRTKDTKALEELAKFKELLETLVFNKKLDQSLRDEATIVLDVLLNENEIPRLMKLLENILRETAQKPEGETQPFQVVGLKLWQSILKRAKYPATMNEVRKWLYDLLEHKNRRVREMSFQLLDELRMKEYGYERLF